MGGTLDDDAIAVLGNRDGMGRNRVPCLSRGDNVKPLKMELSHDAWSDLIRAADSKRLVVRVNRAQLDRLLKDHSALIAHHKGEVIE
jgi:hypothetical protein